jgi:hypothetical protein
MRVGFKNTPNTHFFACFWGEIPGPTLFLEPSERTQFFGKNPITKNTRW